MRSLAEAITNSGHPISHSVISQMENGARRIDVDDLEILASCLGVSPIALLTPHVEEPEKAVGSTTSEDATARGVVINLYKISPELPQWVRDTIADVTGADHENMKRAVSRLRHLHTNLGTNDVDLLFDLALGTWTSRPDVNDEGAKRGND